MSTFRDNWLPNLVSGLVTGLFYFLLGLLLIEQALRPWARKLPRYIRRRDKVVQLTGLRAEFTPGSVSASVSAPDDWTFWE